MTSIHLRLPVVSALVLLFFSAGMAQDPAAGLARHFSSFDVVRWDGSRQVIGLPAAGRRFDLRIAPHDLRPGRYRSVQTTAAGDVELPRTPVLTYKGTVDGSEGSQVRLTMTANAVEGYFVVGGETLFVEPATRYSSAAAPRDLVVYRASAHRNNVELRCDTSVISKLARGVELADSTAAGPSRLEIATDADLEYVNTLGGPAAANAEILSILNMAEGVYERELGLTIDVVFQHTWSTADNFGGANPEATVRAFQAYWNQNYPLAEHPRDTAHLFSAKPNVQSQGWAFIGVVCSSPSAAYGMSGYVDWAPAKFLITTHELGHNIGGNHVDAAQNCANTLMNAQLTGGTPMSFCTYSRGEIGNFVGANGSCMTLPGGCRYDFDGDLRADLGVFRPSNGAWYISRSTGGFSATQFGLLTDTPVSADYDGDGRSDIAVYRGGVWYRLNSGTGVLVSNVFGVETDIPVPGDYDGDGKSDAAVYRPSMQTWFILNSTGGVSSVPFGLSEDIPTPADYDGDGKTDVGIYRPSLGQWWNLRSSNGSVFAASFGSPEDKPTPGDYTGDGKADVAFFRPSDGNWYVLRSEDFSFYAFPFGSGTDKPAPADFDGDGKFDAAVFRPADTNWYILKSTGGVLIQQFGAAGDIPLPGAAVP